MGTSKQFLKSLKLIDSSLVGQAINHSFNSIGSNIFFDFGKKYEVAFPNGTKETEYEWCIWISDSSWRITRNNKYLIGSGEDPAISIQACLQKLRNKRFESFKFLSQFLDIELQFEDGYKVTTFFNWYGENQWCIFLPNHPEITINCETKKSIKETQKLSKQVEIHSRYNPLDYLPQVTIHDIAYTKGKGIQWKGTNDFSFNPGTAAWRLEKNKEYLFGQTDYCFRKEDHREQEFKDIFAKLIGKKIKNIEVDDLGMDVKIQLDDGYIFEVFTDSHNKLWKMTYEGKEIRPSNNTSRVSPF